MMPLFSLEGRTALVTGAAGHLGAAMAGALVAAGAKVHLAGRNRESLELLRRQLPVSPKQPSLLAFDVTDPDAAEKALQQIDHEDGKLDILVNNAYSLVQEADQGRNFHTAYDVSVVAAHRLITFALPLLRKTASSHGASIINIASMYGHVSPDLRIYKDSPPNPVFYGAAKAALIQMTRYLACELAAQSIRVNSVSPGPFPSPHSQENFPMLASELQAKVPLARLGRPEDLAGAVIFLASDASGYVTGIDLAVDGGWTAW